MVIAQGQTLTFAQIMSRLGIKGRNTVYRLVRRGELPEPFRVGSTWRWYERDVVAYLAAQAGKAGNI